MARYQIGSLEFVIDLGTAPMTLPTSWSMESPGQGLGANVAELASKRSLTWPPKDILVTNFFEELRQVVPD